MWGMGIPVWEWVGEREREIKGREGGRAVEDGCTGKMMAR